MEFQISDLHEQTDFRPQTRQLDKLFHLLKLYLSKYVFFDVMDHHINTLSNGKQCMEPTAQFRMQKHDSSK